MKVHELQRLSNSFPVKPAAVDKQGIANKSNPSKSGEQVNRPFSELLSEKIGDSERLKFSAHAMKRLDDRNVTMTPAELQRLENGVKSIEEKGGRSSLILLDDMAYIVSVKNNTVVTAMSKDMASSNVFTNIDSVAIV